MATQVANRGGHHSSTGRLLEGTRRAATEGGEGNSSLARRQ
ncbi:hypothetical protein [Streptomyces ureilyticus]|nr:hypothetical protein [Streptomyces ureilyticus]